MRRMGQGLGLLIVTIFVLSGCKSTQQQLKPPKPPEQFVAPPDEKRYSEPMEFPKDSLNQDKQIYNKAIVDGPGGPGSGKGGPGGGGMGRSGSGGPGG